MNSSEGVNSIQVLTESWKYEHSFLEKFNLDAFKSFSIRYSNNSLLKFVDPRNAKLRLLI